MNFLICLRAWKTAKFREKSGKSLGILRWMISGNPGLTHTTPKLNLAELANSVDIDELASFEIVSMLLFEGNFFGTYVDLSLGALHLIRIPDFCILSKLSCLVGNNLLC